MMKFGTPVSVRAIAVRFKLGNNTVYEGHRDTLRYGSGGQRVDEPWPGTAVPDSKVDLNKDAKLVVVRRLPMHEPMNGFVVGQTWKEEGYVDPRGWGDGGVLLRRGPRVKLYEVALTPSNNRARIELVHEVDLEEL